MSFLVNPYWFAPSCGDADAVAFLAAAGITDATITSAICTLVTTMKADGTWAKCNAIYPMVGGTATTHKFNLKNPLDTNAAFRLSFVGGWTHSSNGVLPNGTNAYADTFIRPDAIFGINSIHISYYRRTTQNASGCLMGTITGTNPNYVRLTLVPNFATGNNNLTEIVSTANQQAGTSNNSLGLICGSRIVNTQFKQYANGVSIQTVTRTSISQPNLNIYIGANNFSLVAGGSNFTNNQCAFASIGGGFTDTEAASLYTDVQAFNTILGRQVP
jgi:hypothetical protein